MYIISIAVIRLLELIELAIIVRAFVSWLPLSRDNAFIKLLYQITEPILSPIRGIIERMTAGRSIMLDFSPIVAILLIEFAIRLLSGFLHVRTLIF